MKNATTDMKNMRKMWVVSHHPSKPTPGFTRQELEASLELDKVVEDRPNFDQSFLYEAESAEDAVKKRSLSVFGPKWAVSAREFTDEEYALAFEKSTHRKIEWLADALKLELYDARCMFDKLSNRKLGQLIEALAGKKIPKASFK